MKKKLLARVLALVMAVSLLSTTALAASFDDLSAAINGGNGDISDNYIEETGRYGYGWNEAENRYGIEAWDADGTRNVQLNEDVTGEANDSINITAGQNVTLDLNDQSINGTGDKGQLVNVQVGGELTITDSGENGAINTDGKWGIVNKGTLNLKDGAVNGTNTYGVYTSGDTTISENADVNGKTYGVWVADGGSLETKGDITGSYGVVASGEDASVKVTDGTVTGTTRAGVQVQKGSDVTVSGGSISGNTYGITVNGSTAEITGGEVTGGSRGVYAHNANAEVSVTDGTITGGSNGIRLSNGANANITGGKVLTSNLTAESDTKAVNIEYGSSATIDGNAYIHGSNGVVIWDENSVLNVNGGTIEGTKFGITGNGQSHGTTINIDGGNIIGGHTGIYHPQNGNLTVNGGTVTGAVTGIEIRSGTLTVNDGEIIGKADKFQAAAFDNGVTTIGAGIAIVQHNTRNPIKATINGGTITGAKALYEANLQENPDEAISKVKPVITGGNLISTDKSVESEDEEYFVSGGKYTQEVDRSYLDEDHYCFAVDFDKTVTGDLHFQVGSVLTGAPMDGTSRNLSVDGTSQLSLNYQLDGNSVPGIVTGVMLPETDDADSTVNTPVIESWSSANDDIASVDENGLVTANGVGTVTITATLYSGQTVTFTITVTTEDNDNSGDGSTTPGGTLPGGDFTFDGAAGGTTITDDEIPLAGLLTLADLLEELRVYEEIEEVELPEDFQWIDHDLAQAIYWGLQEELVVDTEEDPLDPDELLTVGLMREVLANYVELYKGLEDFEVVLEGEDEDLVMDYMDMIARLGTFYEELEAALEDAAA